MTKTISPIDRIMLNNFLYMLMVNMTLFVRALMLVEKKQKNK